MKGITDYLKKEQVDTIRAVALSLDLWHPFHVLSYHIGDQSYLAICPLQCYHKEKLNVRLYFFYNCLNQSFFPVSWIPIDIEVSCRPNY